VFPTLYAFREEKGKILCPVPQCCQPLDPIIVMSKLESRERKRYSTLIQDIIMKEDRRIAQLLSALQEILTLSCPFCRIAVDPLPDACSAILCLNCSSYYCNYCFLCFLSSGQQGETEDKAKAACHIHVSSHNNGNVSSLNETGGDPFLSKELILEGQKKYQEKRLFSCLTLALNNKEYEEEAVHLVSMALLLCYDDVISLGIDIVTVWLTSIHSLSGDGTDNPYLAGFKRRESLEGEEDAHPTVTMRSMSLEGTANNSGKILANAILTNNDIAIRQILTAFKESLELNYCETVVASEEVVETEVPAVPAGEERVLRIAYPLLTLCVLMNLPWVAIELIKLGADLYAKDNKYGRTSLMVILEKNCKDVISFLLSQEYKDLRDATGQGLINWNASLTDEENQYNALHVIARFGHFHMIPLFIKQTQCDINCGKGPYCYSPLSTAILSNQILVARELIRQGADLFHSSIAVGDAGITTPYYLILEKGILLLLKEVVKIFPGILEKSTKSSGFSANIDLQNQQFSVTQDDGYKALHVIIQFQNNSLLSYLIKEQKCKNINDKDNIDHISPFAMAILYGNTVAAKYLLENCYEELDIFSSWFDRGRYPL
jgi:ankyrin repeat protein